MPTYHEIESYLIRLGFTTDSAELRKFSDTLRNVESDIERVAGRIAKDFGIAGATVLTALTGVAAATLGLMDNVAQTDLSYQILARRMFMTTNATREFKIATDALGVSIQDIIFGPTELKERYKDLVDEQRLLMKGFGPDFEKSMLRIRDVRQEFTKMEIAVKYLGMALVSNLSKTFLGNDDIRNRVKSWTDWLITNLQILATQISGALAPVLVDVTNIWKEMGDIGEHAISILLKFFGAIYGDNKLEQGTVNIENVGLALKHVSSSLETVIGWIDRVIAAVDTHPWLLKLFGVATGAVAGGSAGAGVGASIGGVIGTIIEPGGGTIAGGGLGGLIGGSIGAVSGGLAGGALADRISEAKNPDGSSVNIADVARKIAAKISADTGVPAEFVFGQMAHETGDFKHVAAPHNLAGINVPGGKGEDYRNFATWDEFSQTFERMLQSPRYQDALRAASPDDYAAALKRGGWYTGPEDDYRKGISRFGAEYRPMAYRQGSDSNGDIGPITINITQPNATPTEIARVVKATLQDVMGKQAQRNLAQFTGSYV